MFYSGSDDLGLSPRLFANSVPTPRRAEPAPAGSAAPTAQVVQLREVLSARGAVDPVGLPEAQALADTRELLVRGRSSTLSCSAASAM